MLVKIISGTYGHRPILPNGQKSHYVIPVKPGNPPIDVEDAEGERLIGLGVAEAFQPEKIKAPKQEAVETAPDAKYEGVSLEGMSFTELKALAKELGIENVGKVKSKEGMIEAITAVEVDANADKIPVFDAQDVIEE